MPDAQYLSEFNNQTSVLDQELETLSLDYEPKRIQELLDELTAKTFQVHWEHPDLGECTHARMGSWLQIMKLDSHR